MNNKVAIKAKIIKLEKKLKKWAKDYYEFDNPSVSDATYDAEYKLLISLFEKYPDLKTSDSIVNKVGGKVTNKFTKVIHQTPMLSLDNAFDQEDLIKFDKHIKNQLGITQDIEYFCELKIDGLSISLIYENGLLIKAVTRGDGQVGEDVTKNVKTIRDIPHQINFQDKIEFRGEIYMPHDVFTKLNNTSSQKFANPRNAASGTLRQLDSKIVASRNLASFFYTIPNALKLGLYHQSEVLQFIKKLNIVINKHSLVVKGIDKVFNTLNNFYKLKSQVNYDVDGVVVKVNNLKLYEDIGYTSKYPKSMIAYKFPEEIVSTILLDIFPSIGRTGRVNYNAKLNPVKLRGSIVSFATLHNSDYIKGLNLNVGDEVLVKKSGEIIPRVLGVKVKHNHQKWQETTICPSCNEKLIRVPTEVDQYCVNLNCSAKILASIEHFCSKGAMNIVGLSTRTIETLLEHKLITDIASIYELNTKKQQLLTLHGFKEKSVNNLLQAIEKSKNVTLDKFIFALGIRHVGSKVSTILAKRFGSLEKIIVANESEISSILTLGQAVGSSVVNFFKNHSNIKMIHRYLNLGIKIQNLKAPDSNKLQNLTFVLTGELSKPRNYFVDLIEKNGGNVSNSVSKNTDYIVIGINPGSKLDKAYKLQIQIIDEKDLKKMLGKEN